RYEDALRAGNRKRNAGLRAGAGRIPIGPDNLVLRAARLFSERTGFMGGARFRLTKRIPAQAGLGGGSADAAAALLALERLAGLAPSRARRLGWAAELGSDVPFAVLGGTALGLGRGERLKRLRLERSFRALLVVPGWRISTADAFRQIDRNRFGLTDWKAKLRFAQLLGRGPIGPARANRLGNLFEDVLGAKRLEFLSLRDRMLEAGVTSVSLSGSGSAVFGVIPPGVPSHVVVGRFKGSEPHGVVRSERVGMQLEILP
ncbi:MAG: hypothetical protein ABIS67_07945, partial [Candidatus Eisenbacteria bacterium]